MNGGHHAELAEWALENFEIGRESSALDIGCGGGANLVRLLEHCRHVTGIDYSKVSVSKSSKLNAKAIKQGRCEVVEGNVADLPFQPCSFDLITAFETIYFWPDIENSYRQVFKVLKPGGRFMIVNESDGTDPEYNNWENIIEGMHTYTAGEIEASLKAAGFESVSVTRKQGSFMKVIASRAAD